MNYRVFVLKCIDEYICNGMFGNDRYRFDVLRGMLPLTSTNANKRKNYKHWNKCYKYYISRLSMIKICKIFY